LHEITSANGRRHEITSTDEKSLPAHANFMPDSNQSKAITSTFRDGWPPLLVKKKGAPWAPDRFAGNDTT
jgi:hypothetical protein